MTTRLKGLYALTPDLHHTALLLEQVHAALAGGAAWLQYRNKTAPYALQRSQALALRDLCRGFSVPLIINDSVELAAETGADGVHLGAEDGGVREARSRLGADKIIGVSCYNSLQRAYSAQEEGADYVAFGSFFASSTKPGAVTAPPDLLARAKRRLHIPVAAIGGITPANGRVLLQHGADALAVVSALFDSNDIAAASRQFGDLFGGMEE